MNDLYIYLQYIPRLVKGRVYVYRSVYGLPDVLPLAEQNRFAEYNGSFCGI